MEKETLYRICFVGWSSLDGIYRHQLCLLTKPQLEQYELLEKEKGKIDSKAYAVKCAKENERYTVTEYVIPKWGRKSIVNDLLLDDSMMLFSNSKMTPQTRDALFALFKTRNLHTKQ